MWQMIVKLLTDEAANECELREITILKTKK